MPYMPADFPLFLAPMAGVTNTVFRRICKARGADFLTTEFVSAEGILHRNARTKYYLEFQEEERPLSVQFFGAEPSRLAEAARAVIDWVHPDFLDLNFGCPVNKVVCKNGGSSLLRDCPLLARVAGAVVRAADPVPVTAKIRIGWDHRSINAVETAGILERSGVQRIAVHGRTKEQGYSGGADWSVIDHVAHSVGIPVIGNGDIASAEDALKRRRETAVTGLMIGRAAMASPWIFSENSQRVAKRMRNTSAHTRGAMAFDPRTLLSGNPLETRRAHGDEIHAVSPDGEHPRHARRTATSREAFPR